MKIALISVNLHTKTLNFASMLHSYVFQQFLKKNGIDSTVIDYYPSYFKGFDVAHPLFWYAEHSSKNRQKWKGRLSRYTKIFYEREKRAELFDRFEETRYKKTEKAYTIEELEKTDLGFDCYICVTDVIWRRFSTGFDRGLFLACDSMKGKKKIAYAASRSGEYTKEDKKEFIELIKDFDVISSREDSFCEYIENCSGLSIPHVVDPVFLMPKSFYVELAVRPEFVPDGKDFVVVYIAMENNRELVEQAYRFAQKKGLFLVELSEYPDNAKEFSDSVHKRVYDIGVEQWLWYLLNAKYVFTQSFHGCCLSIIFHKQLYVGKRGGEKIPSLLRMFDLYSRSIADEDLDNADIKLEDIDFSPVDEIIKKESERSASFILGAIRNLENREHTPLIADTKELIRRIDEGESGQNVEEKS